MGKILTESQNYTDIAAAIRAKKNVTTTYKPDEMASAISSIFVGVDTSDDTVIANKLVAGYTAHNANGEPITGTMQTIGRAGITWQELTSSTWGILSGS